ncbi:MAG TPA: type IV secretion system protein [Allosphingosinicella sp.]|jgi:type IV secretion system protein VirB6
MACETIPADEAVLRGVLDFIDCQAQTIGAEGYRALAAPGSSLSLVLLGFLTLFVALFGYRMLLGRIPGVRDGVLALIKIGIVLALATGWTAYRTLVYDVAFHAPAELAAEIGRPSALPGSGGGLVPRLDQADRTMVALAALGTGQPVAGAATTPAAEPGQPALPTAASREIQSYDTLAMAGARVLFLAGAIGSLAAVRLIAGLMLAVGPFFIAFLLFLGTRGLFEGWLRVLGGAALGALGAGIVLGVELALLEPWLNHLLARRLAEQPITGVPIQLFAVTLVFAIALAAVVIASARAAYGLRLPAPWPDSPELPAVLRAETLRAAGIVREPAAAAADRSRAVMVADAVAATQRRESGPVAPGAFAPAASSTQVARHLTVHDRAAAPPPPRLGQSFRRRTGSRVSASAGRRDRTS